MAEAYTKADERGVPSLVWRAGQERRLKMIQATAEDRLAPDKKVLVNGCGVGMYNRALLGFTPHVYGLDIEAERVREAARRVPNLLVAIGERLPYADEQFDLILSHEVIEHVQDDARYAAEMVRVLKPGGRAIIFCPNRLYPFETHGHYWRGKYYFGNTPLINYLPNIWRNKLAPHVRAYTTSGLQSLFSGLPVKIVSHTQIYPGYDNIVYRWPGPGNLLRRAACALERTPLRVFGISHLLVVEKSIA
ncbi:MAG TPA: class I SAM-dependent methyltransferase [Chloroflexi bacterium]|nr:class I SAM-dependent methyltransferase [Chloroflexota bacterium]